jgi:hypothetical protein
MTVGQLIATLRNFPPELDVLLESADGHANPVRSAALDLVHKKSRQLWSEAATGSDESQYDNLVVIYWSWHPDDDPERRQPPDKASSPS